MTDEFDLNGWFDLSKPISKVQLEEVEIDIQFYGMKDREEDSVIKSEIRRLKKAVKKHNSKMQPPPPVSSHRHVLYGLNGQRFRCKATVGKFGTKLGYKGKSLPTIMLKNVIDPKTETLLTDHLWFTMGKWADELQVGDTIEFDARVAEYEKGEGRRDDNHPIKIDYRLERPTKIVKILKKENLQ